MPSRYPLVFLYAALTLSLFVGVTLRAEARSWSAWAGHHHAAVTPGK